MTTPIYALGAKRCLFDACRDMKAEYSKSTGQTLKPVKIAQAAQSVLLQAKQAENSK